MAFASVHGVPALATGDMLAGVSVEEGMPRVDVLLSAIAAPGPTA